MGKITGAIEPVTFEKAKTILNQMKYSICKIIAEKKKGTGFFIYLKSNEEKIPVLMTNYHIIVDDFIK